MPQHAPALVPDPKKVVKLKAGNAHARYMRFWRSVQPPKKSDCKVPPQLLQTYQTLKGTRGGLTSLLEDWIQAGEDWSQSALVVHLTQSKSEAARGRFKWVSKADLIARYGDTDAAKELIADLIQRKVVDGHVKDDPNFPGRKEFRLYLCWDSSVLDTTEEVACRNDLSSSVDVTNKDSVMSILKSDLFKQDRMAMPGVPGRAGSVKGGGTPPKPQVQNTGPMDTSASVDPPTLPPGKGEKPKKPKKETKPKDEKQTVAMDPLKKARNDANKLIKDIGPLMMETMDWESKLTGVAPQMLGPLKALAEDWHMKLGTARSTLEGVMVDALKAKDHMMLNNATSETKALLEQFATESQSAKRLMAPAPKAKAKAKAKAAA